MTEKSILSLIVEKIGLTLYQKSLKFPSNKINIIFIRDEPLKIRSVILDNDREYHLIIDEKNNEIFHDCPLFLIHSERDKKICVHLIKLLMVVKTQYSNKVLANLDKYILSSDDLGSKKKAKNFQILADNCFEGNNCVEALNYLNKAIISQDNNEGIIENFLTLAINNNLFIEFFEFLKKGYDDELNDYFIQFNDYIEVGFERFLNVIHKYSFYNILKIIELIDKIVEFKGISLIKPLIRKLNKLINSKHFNDNYLSIYLILKNKKDLVEYNKEFKEIVTQDRLTKFRGKLVYYFKSEIENFCLIDKLKLLKKHFSIIGIPKVSFNREYKNYKQEIKQLEKKLYLKKFAFLKLLTEKYNINVSKGDFRKKRNAYIVKHDEENLKNPVYNYIISRLGFFGLNDQIIKSSEIGINYFFMKVLFLDDLSSFQDVDYYKTQFWGENDYTINSINGFSLLSKNVEYSYENEQKYSDEINIIEWDLASKPIQGSIVIAYGSQIIIPDQDNPLFHDLKPFDLCYCKKTPIKIESNMVKTVNVITKCSFKDAIKSVSLGMTFIEGYYPLSLVKAVLDKEINPFQANRLVVENPNKIFIPNYAQFIQSFREFLFSFVIKEKKFIFEELKSDFVSKIDQLLLLLDLTNELSGLNLPFSEFLREVLTLDLNINEMRSKIISETHKYIISILDKRVLGSTEIFDLKKLRNTSFIKYANEILKIRKEEFESTTVTRFYEDDEIRYELSEINKTYYGKKFLEILQLRDTTLKSDEFKKLHNFSLKLNLKLKYIDVRVKKNLL
ncbi:MAG: hypothetical protein KGD65_02085 [Candidatus Lokiarchaeota archaeon]|nr:hypothetical protein [Candidatus Lokiarchaeota archaeon]